MTNTKPNPLEDWNSFFKELTEESPRASVIIASAFLDAQLRVLISKFLVDDPEVVNDLLGNEKKFDRPLSSFGARIGAAYCLGLIGRDIYDDLIIIKKIRNKFAHEMHGYTFDEPEIVKWCKSLKLAKMLTNSIPDFPKSHGSMYLSEVVQLANEIGLRTLAVNKSRRTIP